MLKLSRYLSPMSWFLGVSLMAPSWMTLFSPSWRDIGLLVVAELLTYLVAAAVCARLLKKTQPYMNLFSHKLNWQALQALTGEGQELLLKSLRSFPSLRLCCGIPVVAILSTPVAAVIYFMWPDNGSEWHLTKTVAVVVLTRVYGLGCAFIDGNFAVSRLREEIRERLGWPAAFARERTVRPSTAVEWVELVVIATLLAFYTLAAFIILSEGARPLEQTIAIVAFQMAVCFIMAMYFQYLVRKYRDGFLNDVTRRLDEKERELSTWVLDHSERQRFRTFGEVAGLVVHDLANPIHTVAFCAEALAENPQSTKRDNYIEIILKNCEKVSSLIKSLRTYLKKGTAENHACLALVHRNVIDILSIQYATKNFQRMKLEWDEGLNETWVKIASNEIMHILLNVYANAVKNFLEHDHAEPCIKTELVKRDEGFVTFAVADNGAGLSPQGFESLIAAGFMVTPQGRREGLGLRLGARLLEQHGGAIYIDEGYFQEGRGTRLLLKLPVFVPTNPA